VSLATAITTPVSNSGIARAAISDELLTVRLRYKQPAGDVSQKLEFAVTDRGTPFAQANGDFQFASAVAMWGMLLKNSPYRGQSSFDLVLELAQTARDNDPTGYRAEFFELVRLARGIRSELLSRRDFSGD
jgi:Ca-activated chloride channel family protein